MAIGISGSKGGIKNKEKTFSENFVELFTSLTKSNKKTYKDGNRFFRE